MNKQIKYKNKQWLRMQKRLKDNKEYDNYNNVFTYDNLLYSALKCKRNVTWKMSVQKFLMELFYNVFIIYQALINRNFKINSSYEFDLCERGKLRHIRSVHIRERVVQKCLCDYCLLPILSKTFIYDNCASLKGKGIDFAINRLKKHINSFYTKYGLDGYVLLFDFSDYFASISHQKILGLFEKYITDKEIINLIKMFIEMEYNNKGLSLGNEISQVAALLMANPIDHYIKDKCQVKYYIRYMDDGIIIHNDKNFLLSLLNDIQQISNNLGLKINMKKN